MSFKTGPRILSPPTFWTRAKPEDFMRKLSLVAQGLLDGKSNNSFVVTLEAGKTQTDVRFLPARPGAAVNISPRNAVAAELARTSDVYADAQTEKVCIFHAATATGAEQFSLTVTG